MAIMRWNKEPYKNKNTFVSLHIHPYTLETHAEQSNKLVLECTSLSFFFRHDLTISKPEKQNDAKYSTGQWKLSYFLLWQNCDL